MTTSISISNKYWSPDFTAKFINMYKELPCLWRMKSPDYNNKFKRDEAYQKLVQLCETVYKGANTDYVKQRIQSLRGSFRKELKKVIDSKNANTSPEGRYVPKLWYFDLLLFTREQENSNQSVSSAMSDKELSDTENNVDDLHFTDEALHPHKNSARLQHKENSDVVLEFSEESFSGDCDGEDEDDGDDSSVQRVIKWVSNREHLLQADIEKKQFELQHELAEHDQLQVVGAELRKLDKIIKDKRKCLKRLRDKSEITEAEQKKKCFLGIEFLHLQNKVPGDYEIPDTYGVKIEKI